MLALSIGRLAMVQRNIKLPLRRPHDARPGPRPSRVRRLAPAIASAAIALSVVACGEASSDADECTSGAECVSGACSDGKCLPQAGGAGGQSGAGGAAGAAAGGGGTAGGGGVAGSGATAGSGGSTLCSPNHDGIIERAEVPLAAGLNAKFLTSGVASVSSAGDLQSDGSRVWDLSGPLSGDHLVLAETQKLDGKWFAPKFPGATYAARLSESSDLLGVFEVTDAALLLRGVVSPSDGLTRTELSYAPPVVVLDFPLAEGKSFSTSANVTGLAQGVLAAYTEAYESQVDARGTLKAPFGDFPVLRTRVVLTRKVGLVTTVVRSYLFGTECFGTVAAIVAKDNEPAQEVSSAAEVRRLSP